MHALALQALGAATIYLAPDGSDNHTISSRENPFKTLRHAASMLAHGQLVMLAGAYPGEGNTDLTFTSRQLNISAQGAVTIECGGRPGLTLKLGHYNLKGVRWQGCHTALTVRDANASLDGCVAVLRSVAWASGATAASRCLAPITL